MRSVLVGFVGAVLAVGGAQAAGSCRADHATVKVVDTGVRYAGTEVERTDLVGQTFRIYRYADQRRMVDSAARSAPMRLGYEAYELKGRSGTYLVRRDHVDGSPSIAPVSWASASANAGEVAWKRSRPERVKVGQSLDYVLSGPLSALTVQVASCR